MGEMTVDRFYMACDYGWIDEPEGGGLTVIKDVSGQATVDSWAFSLTLEDATYTDKAPAVYSGERGESTVDFVNGVCAFTLGAGESVTITDLPLVAYSIRETDTGGADSVIWYDEEGAPVVGCSSNNYDECYVTGVISSEGGEIKCTNGYRAYYPLPEETVP